MMIDGSWWESGLTAWWYFRGRGVVMEHPNLSHCTWLGDFGMIRETDYMRQWWMPSDDRVRWLSENIDDYHKDSVGAFTRFQRGWYDYVGRMPIFNIGHLRSWKHDVRGCGQMMGGHHFRSLFTISPSHIKSPVASPLSLTWVP